jgi:hypothetical protein
MIEFNELSKLSQTCLTLKAELSVFANQLFNSEDKNLREIGTKIRILSLLPLVRCQSSEGENKPYTLKLWKNPIENFNEWPPQFRKNFLNQNEEFKPIIRIEKLNSILPNKDEFSILKLVEDPFKTLPSDYFSFIVSNGFLLDDRIDASKILMRYPDLTDKMWGMKSYLFLAPSSMFAPYFMNFVKDLLEVTNDKKNSPVTNILLSFSKGKGCSIQGRMDALRLLYLNSDIPVKEMVLENFASLLTDPTENETFRGCASSFLKQYYEKNVTDEMIARFFEQFKNY